MGDSPHSGDNKRSQRMDEELARDPSDEDAQINPDLWDTPGHDFVVGPTDSDHDRNDFRADIGEYVSLVEFPAKAKDIVAAAQSHDAPIDVLEELRRLEPESSYPNMAAMWEALNLRSDRRF